MSRSGSGAAQSKPGKRRAIPQIDRCANRVEKPLIRVENPGDARRWPVDFRRTHTAPTDNSQDFAQLKPLKPRSMPIKTGVFHTSGDYDGLFLKCSGSVFVNRSICEKTANAFGWHPYRCAAGHWHAVKLPARKGVA